MICSGLKQWNSLQKQSCRVQRKGLKEWSTKNAYRLNVVLKHIAELWDNTKQKQEPAPLVQTTTAIVSEAELANVYVCCN